MLQHKQEERELKRYEGDIIKKQHHLRRTMAEYENSKGKTILIVCHQESLTGNIPPSPTKVIFALSPPPHPPNCRMPSKFTRTVHTCMHVASCFLKLILISNKFN